MHTENQTLETLRFLTPEIARDIAARHGTPVYVYDEATLLKRAGECLTFPNAFGLTVRYAMKACPNRRILRLFHELGLHIDASSGHEVERAIAAGIPPDHISLSAQELPLNLGALLDQGVLLNATSLEQIKTAGTLRRGAAIGLRFNPGLGSGGTNRTNVGGPASSFGIWHEHADEARKLLESYHLKCVRIHTHIGSGGDPAVWQRVAGLSLALVERFEDVVALDLGGGFKVARMKTETGTDLRNAGAPVKAALEAFAAKTGRKIHLEIEPGTYLVANAGCLLSTVQDIVDTGKDGYLFYRLDTGMTDVLRPSLYGAQHPLVVIPHTPRTQPGPVREVIVVGHCCESGDILTPAPGDPEALSPRPLEQAEIGDLLAIEGVGAYCAAMCTRNYNSFPASPEVLLSVNRNPVLIRKRQPVDDIWHLEC
ncbi:MAG: diaminopimelate decarboxylase [Verrucomicrobia bacterium]|nr:diaminopimelate decarboxylase [Verrucomicrobiota bacterium]MCH8514192.1 diaminopimelate decarboxylase [Kiritimatiellia bacterium]